MDYALRGERLQKKIKSTLSRRFRDNSVDGLRFPSAILTFGDSTVDVGNNNYLLTIFKANFPPYGRDFPGQNATGRFSNGRLVMDIMADNILSLKSAPAYLSPDAMGNNLLIGANFASAGSGYDDRTALLSGALSLPAQFSYFKQYQRRLVKLVGSTSAANITNSSVYVCSFGNSDFMQNYYINPLVHNAYSPNQYSDYLVSIFSKFIKDLYMLGARRIGVTSLPPLGCLPLAKTLFGADKNGCVAKMNGDARAFNRRINKAANMLKAQHHDLKLVVLDIYTPLYNMTRYPASYGFTEWRKGCCGTGTIETTTLLCNPLSLGTCLNATQYLFFDSVHPASQRIYNSLLNQGFALVDNTLIIATTYVFLNLCLSFKRD